MRPANRLIPTPLPGRTRRDSIEVVLTRVPERVFRLPAARARCSAVALLTVGCAAAAARPIPESMTAAGNPSTESAPAPTVPPPDGATALETLPPEFKALDRKPEPLHFGWVPYFDHIKQAVAAAWDPTSVLRARDPTGGRFAYKDRTTVVAVTLNDQGGLTEVHVTETSDVDFLDQIAVEAFRKAQPFGKPPPGVADAHGQIRFRFGFHLETAFRRAPLPNDSH